MHSSTHRTLLAIAVLVLSVAMLIRALPEARGHGLGPSVMGGEAPWVSISGSTSGGTVYTVPSDRAFVMTGACMEATGAPYAGSIYENSTLKVHEYSLAGSECENSSGFLGEGRAHIVFEPGSTVDLDSTSGSIHYTIQGYLAHP